MTTPKIPEAPDNAFVVGSTYGSDLTESSIQALATGGAKVSFTGVQNAVGSQVRTPIDNVRLQAIAANDLASEAVSVAEAAANEAANAGELADIAYENAHEWSLEFVVASAAVELGRNELLLGPMLNVRGNRLAIMTDVHIALLEQPGGITIDTRKWNAPVTAFTVAHTGTLDPNVTLRSFSGLTVPVLDKERFFPNVAAVVGTVAPNVLQICVAGVYIPL